MIKSETSIGYLFSLERKGADNGFDPRQARDENGMWSSGNSSGNGSNDKFPRGKNPDGGGLAFPGDRIQALGRWHYVVGEHGNYYLVQSRAPKRGDFDNPPLNDAVHRSDVTAVKITEYSQ